MGAELGPIFTNIFSAPNSTLITGIHLNTSGFTHSVLGLIANFTTIVLINTPNLSETSNNSDYNLSVL